MVKACYAIAKRPPEYTEDSNGAWVAAPSGIAHFFRRYGSGKPVVSLSVCGIKYESWPKTERKRKCLRCLYLKGEIAMNRRVKCPTTT